VHLILRRTLEAQLDQEYPVFQSYLTDLKVREGQKSPLHQSVQALPEGQEVRLVAQAASFLRLQPY
jgi:hypothetical protein